MPINPAPDARTLLPSAVGDVPSLAVPARRREDARPPLYGAGCVMALLSRLTAVCASRRLLAEAPVPKTIAVL